MSEQVTTARPYAKAAFLTAVEGGSYDIWDQKLKLLEQIVSDPSVVQSINSPALTKLEKAQLIVDICGELPVEVSNFIKTMAENGRLLLAPYIAELFEQYRTDAGGIVRADVISAVPLGEAELDKLRVALVKRFEKDVKITPVLDESLLSGALIKVGDVVIDGSLKGRIEKLSQSIVA